MADAADTPQGQQQAHSQQLQPQQSQGAQSASTPVMRSGDTVVGEQQQSGHLRSREADAAALYNTTLRQLQTENTFPTLEQNLREYLAGRMSAEMMQYVDQYCTVEEYLQQPAAFCADEQVRHRIDTMPGMRVACDLLRMVDAGYVTVGSWAKAGMLRNVTDVSAATYGYMEFIVDAAAARAAQRRRVESAGAKDEYGQTCEQLLPTGVGKALYESVRDATWRALRYTTADRDNGVRAASKGVAVLAQPLDDLGMEVPQGDKHYAAQHDTEGDVLYTLHSRHGWPTMWSEGAEVVNGKLPATTPVAPESAPAIKVNSGEYYSTLFVRYEVQRAWRNIAALYNERNPSAMLDTLPFVVQPPPVQTLPQAVKPVAVLVHGAPGIGKTMSGNYMVYRLLHDAKAPQRIAFAVDECVYVFDKQHKRVSCYERRTFHRHAFVKGCSRRCVYIHDCGKGKYALHQSSHCHEALAVVLSSPNSENYTHYMEQALPDGAKTYVVTHTWSYRELYCVARLVGFDHDVMQDRVFTVGPLPRYVLDETLFTERARKVRTMCGVVATAVDRVHYRLASAMAMNAVDQRNPTSVLYDLRRSDLPELYSERATTGAASEFAIVVQRGDDYVVESLIDLSGTTTRLMSTGVLQKIHDILLQQSKNQLDAFYKLTAEVLSHGQSHEMLVKMAIVVPRFWQQLHDSIDKGGAPRFRHCLVTKGSAATTTPLTLADIQQWAAGYENTSFQEVEVDSSKRVKLGAKVNVCVYVPLKRNFTLVDAFLLIRHDGGVHFVGVQATIGNQHPVTNNNVLHFIDDLPEMDIEPAATTTSTHNAGRGSDHEQRDSSAAHDATARDGSDATTTTSQQPSSSLSAAHARQGAQRGTNLTVQDAREEKLARLKRCIKSWSVLYIGEHLSVRNKFELQSIPKQVKQSAGTATTAADGAAAPATASHCDDRGTAAVTSSMPAADAVQRQEGQAQHDADSSDTMTTTDEAHQATRDDYTKFWDETHRYLYTESSAHIYNLTKNQI